MTIVVGDDMQMVKKGEIHEADRQAGRQEAKRRENAAGVS